eukprot:2366259-Prorocentrum_lima.AAC.1
MHHARQASQGQGRRLYASTVKSRVGRGEQGSSRPGQAIKVRWARSLSPNRRAAQEGKAG